MSFEVKKSVKSSSVAPAIIGIYEGEALDTKITNKNGLDITKEVIDCVLKSEDYKDGIENGWFIGFLGHPEDPDCQDFQNGCIVMTEMSLDDNGKVYGKFNLIDTPVGRTVKAFQDAGVNFGISIRGAGDIVGNAVEPDTFVFRGFDLVAFPAYPESIPTFTAIAASTKLEERRKYKAVCATVKSNLPNITSATALEVLQEQFAPQSPEYAAIAARHNEIKSEVTLNIDSQKIAAMADRYVDALHQITVLASECEELKRQNAITASTYNRKLESVKRISGRQIEDALKSLDSITASRDSLEKKTASLRKSNRSLKKINASLEHDKQDLTEQLRAEKKTNLIYKQKIAASKTNLEDKEEIIASLQEELRETVTASTKSANRSSNLDEQVKSLKSEIRTSRSDLSTCQSELDEQREISEQLRAEIKACRENLSAFQSAYAQIYAGVLGVSCDSVQISANTSVPELQKSISGAANTASIPAGVQEDAEIYYENELSDLVTM